MQVFISWSGERSKLIAEALRGWLPKVVQSLVPWMSAQDIGAGARWLSEVSSTLNNTKIGLICVTQENQHSPWLLFEAGALSKSIEQTCVCPLAFEMTPGQIDGPLTQFQANTLDRIGIGKVLSTINTQLGDRRIESKELEEIIDVWWPKLDEKLKQIPSSPSITKTRSTNDQLEELLTLAREQIRRENIRLEASKERDEKLESMLSFMEKAGAMMSVAQNQITRITANPGKITDFAISNLTHTDLINKTNTIEPNRTQVNSSEPLNAIREATELMRDMQERDKQRTERMLNPPEPGHN